MSKVSKPNLQMYATSKERIEKSTKKPVPAQKKTASKEDVTVKRKPTKENGDTKAQIDSEKKREKKLPTASKSSTNGEKRHSSTEHRGDAKLVKTKSVKSTEKVTSTKREPEKNEKTVKKPTATQSKSIVQNGKVSESTKKSSSKERSVSKRQVPVPMKASHSVVTKVPAISSKNVMNQIHNVTVSSPPPVRREIILNEATEMQDKSLEPGIPRERTRTRTLDESEIVILKPKHAGETATTTNIRKPEIDQAARDTLDKHAQIEIKQPISFEVLLNEDMPSKTPTKPQQVEMSTQKKVEEPKADDSVAEEDDDYEDDFESYESDFESEISSEDQSNEENRTSESETTIESGDSEEDDNVVSTSSKHPFDTRGQSVDNSEFDSGSFELKVLSARTQRKENVPAVVASKHELQYEMQNDSGIENNSNIMNNGNASSVNGQLNSLDFNSKTFDNISDIEAEAGNSLDTNNNTNNNGQSRYSEQRPKATQSKMSKRGEELLRKIMLDTMNYVLCDFKPIPYDVFMKIYGNSNTTQASVQTHNNRSDQECQSDAIEMQSIWTQHPITFYSRHIAQHDFADYKNGFGAVAKANNERMNQMFGNCLSFIQNVSVDNNSGGYEERQKQQNMQMIGAFNIDYENLNRFLLENELTLSRILNARSSNMKKRQLRESLIPISNGYFELNLLSHAMLNDLQMSRIIATNSLPGFLFTLHRDATTKLNVIAIWNLVNVKTIVCFLSVWSTVLCVEVHSEIRDVVFAGLDDGSIAVWDYSESKYWHPTMHETNKRFVPSQIVMPTFSAESINDTGRCVAIRSLSISSDNEFLIGCNPKQICSLHECGILTLWTVMSKSPNSIQSELPSKRIDHQSMWSKIKLVQNKSIDLRQSIGRQLDLLLERPTSSKSFDKTRSYFESELFSDAALQELQQNGPVEPKFINSFGCSALELTHEGILVATNENFLLFGRKSFKNESFRKIQISTEHNTRVGCMATLTGYDDDIVLASLNDGTVRSFCCDQNLEHLDENCANSDVEEGSTSSITSLPPTLATNSVLPLNLMESHGSSSSYGSVQVLTANFMPDAGSVGGKSCAIQSLVQNERKMHDEMQALNNLDNNEYKMPTNSMPIKSMQQSTNISNLVNGQTIMSDAFGLSPPVEPGTNTIFVYLMKSNKIVALVNNHLRICDLVTNEVISLATNDATVNRYVGATTTIGDHNEEYLILLKSSGNVEVHRIITEKPDAS